VRVAVLTHSFPVASDTPFLNQVVGLVERGHEVEIFADRPQPDVAFHPDVARLGLEAMTRYPERFRGSLPERWTQAAGLVRAHRGGDRRTLLRTLNPLVFWRRAWSLDQLRRTARFLPRREHDICYCAFGQDAPHALRLRRLGVLGGPLVVAFRGADTTKYVGRRGAAVYAATFRRGRLFLPVSESLARRLRDLGAPAERVVVHRTGIDPRRWPFRARVPDASGRMRVATVGRLVEKKGIEYVLRALRLLKDEAIYLECEVIGEGPLRPVLERAAAALGVADRVAFTGWQSQTSVRERLERAHVLVAASVTGRDADEEGIPNVLKEAMALGLPVVGTRHGGIPELVEDDVSGLLVPERDEHALAGALRRLATTPGRWAHMGRAGREAIEREYDIERLNTRLAGLFEDLLRPAALGR
jgi:colanic acid/amylovoran biosynthesis glycosyltransferase